jgi:protoporphyrinogen oxidase
MMSIGSAEGKSVVIIGGGPAGLTASYELSKHNVPAVVLEADNIVGGISRTVNYKGYLFDIGGHRFFSKCAEVNQIWEEILHGQFLERPRLSRIYYRNKFFYYPRKPKNALFGLGLLEAMRIVASYAWSRVNPHPKEDNLEEWVSNRFGKRLYEIFFKTYTEKFGVCRARKSAPNGRRSAFAAFRSPPPSRTPSSARKSPRSRR